MKKMQATIDSEQDQIDTKYVVQCITKDLASFEKWTEALKSEDMRRSIIENGAMQADAFQRGLCPPAPQALEPPHEG